MTTREAARERGTIDEAVAILGICARTVRHLALLGEFQGAAKIGRRWTFNLERLREYVKQKEREVMSKRKAPKGTFWRGPILWGRIQADGADIRWSLRTDDPVVALARRKRERDRQIAVSKFGDERKTFAEALESWGLI